MKLMILLLCFFSTTCFSFGQDINHWLQISAAPSYTNQRVDVSGIKSRASFFLANFQLIVKPSNNIGIGITTGYQVKKNAHAVPIGGVINYYFDLNTHADDEAQGITPYIGINGGGGRVTLPGSQHGDLTFFGGQAGLKVWTTSNLGFYAEVGYGKSIAAFGIIYAPK